MTNKVMRKIAIRNFYGNGKHIYEDQMEDQFIATFDDITDVWDGLKIDGKDFKEVINHSYIVALN